MDAEDRAAPGFGSHASARGPAENGHFRQKLAASPFHSYKVMFQEEERFGVAHALEKPAMEFLPDEGTVENWKPLLMELRGGDFPDYLSSNLGCRMCSERLRKILQEHRSPLDLLQWLDVVVKDKQEDRNYFILHFPQTA